MIRSMTGYGSASFELEPLRAAVTVRSVNHRYLDIALRLPRDQEAVRELRGSEATALWDVADLGCGTGLCGPGLRGRAGRLVGVDLSPEMLARAREHFPVVPFHNLAVTQLAMEAEFDGACSLSSMLYLDPIDFFHAIYRLYRALKPGGLLFLYGYDTHPGWRGHPFKQTLDQWMWSWTRSPGEAVSALEEHGYFSVLQAVEMPPLMDEAPEQAEASPNTPVPLAEVTEALEQLSPDAPPYKLPSFPVPKRTKPFDYTIIARRNDSP